jgi:hypothetical protein
MSILMEKGRISVLGLACMKKDMPEIPWKCSSQTMTCNFHM